MSLLVFFALMCYPGKERMHEYMLMRYTQIESVEKQFKSVVNLIRLEQSPKTNALFKQKYRRDLEKSFGTSQELHEDEQNNQNKLAKLLKTKDPLFDNPTNAFDEKVQLGFSIENRMYKQSYLRGLEGKVISVNARILNVNTAGSRAVLQSRLPFSQEISKTSKLLLTYVTASTKSMGKLTSIRRYQDVSMKVKVADISLSESSNYVVVYIDGKLEEIENRGWLGIQKWKDETPYLPKPSAKKKKKSKKGKKERRKKKKSSSDPIASAKSKVNKAATKATDTIKKVKTTAEQSLEQEWKEDDEDW